MEPKTRPYSPRPLLGWGRGRGASVIRQNPADFVRNTFELRPIHTALTLQKRSGFSPSSGENRIPPPPLLNPQSGAVISKMLSMELPEDIKRSYRHWEFHTTETAKNISHVPKEISWFVGERVKIWKRKVSGKEPPYTKDPILSRYRFCNIFRELDRQTVEIHTLLNPLRDNFPLWLLNIFYARMVARPETLRTAGLLSFKQKENQSLYKRLMTLPRPRFGTAYVFPISVIQGSSTPTRELFITMYLPREMRAVAREVQRWRGMSVYDGVQKVL